MRIRMRRFRFGWFLVASLAAALLVRDGPGKAQAYPVWQRANLSAVDRGVTPAALSPPLRTTPRRVQVAGAPGDRIGRTGAAYQPGRLIVKFRTGMSTAARANAMAQVSPSAAMAPPTTGANFDIVNFDPA